MFTGIVEEVGKISQIRRKPGLWQIGVLSNLTYKDAQASDSIAVNGVCLTIVEKKNNTLFFDVVKPTLDNTNLKHLKINSLVNLEPSLRVGEKLGGHFVLGHVDCQLRIKSIQRLGDYVVFNINYPNQFKKYLVEKGSVALEGISLTIQKLSIAYFTVNIIPYTLEHTNLRYKKTGDKLNAEFDYLLKSKSSK